MRYCRNCVEPDTRPGIVLNAEGVCSACQGHIEKERHIDWTDRRRQLEQLLDSARGANGANYDCIVPVSGGKDSTYQTYLMKEVFHMNPLCVCYRTPLRTELGQRNLDNMTRALKVDLIELTVSPETERKFILKALCEKGDCGIPQHLGIFAFTLRMAVALHIPLVVWGENPELEYGGSRADRENPYLDYAWLRKHGCLQQRLAEDWVDRDLTLEEMRPFLLPPDEALKAARIQTIFLGYYLRWDPVQNAAIAKSVGFESRAEGPVMGIYDFADLDCKLITLHHYPKWYKFGMTRTFDNCSVEIRNGRMTREEAIECIRRNRDDLPPADHIQSVCRFLNISEEQLFAALEPHRNGDIWKRDAGGRLHIPGYIAGDSFAGRD